MKIKINGIFDKYNNTVDLERKCNIFIGENGIGKSTTMKIINSLLVGDLVELLKYYFSSIEIIDNDTKLIIKYEDLFPALEDVLKMTKRIKFNNDYNSLQLNGNSIIKHFDKLVKLINNNTHTYNNLLRTVLNEGLDFSFEGFKRQYNVENEDLFTCSYLILTFYRRVIEIKEYNNIKYIDETTFSKNKTYELLEKILNKYKNVFLISTVKEIDIINDIYILGSSYYSKSTELLNENNNSKLEITDKERLLRNIIEEKGLDYLIDNVELDNTYNYYNIYEDLTGKYNEDNKSTINIRKLLFKNYYSEEVIKKFIVDYYNMLKKMIYREYSQEELNVDLITTNKDLYNKYKFFIEPLIPINSFYRNFNIETFINRFPYETKVFNKFILDNLEYYMSCENDKIKKLNYLLEEYFKNKKIYSSPNGLIISDEKDYNNRYNLKYLSEGEKRIILLLLLTVMNENNVLLLDEVETSLSVIWQKRLVSDILKYGKIDNLIVSTQSPFIVEDDSLFEYVICLPNNARGEKNGN